MLTLCEIPGSLESTQFIVITHRKGAMEAAHVLHGVTMEKVGCLSSTISVKLGKKGRHGILEHLKDGLSKTRRNFTDCIRRDMGMSAKVDRSFLEELEMILLSGDVGVKPQKSLSTLFVRLLKENRGTEQVMHRSSKYIAEMLRDEGQRTRIGAKPTVILVVGVNGVGKTTTIGKLANYFHLFKYKVMLAAGDTFRAAAEQLQIWGERAGCEVIRHEEALTRLPWF